MRKSLRVAAAGVMMAALGGAGLVAASPASADTYYNVQISHNAGFTADFCIHAQNYDNGNDIRSSCSGDQIVGASTRLSVPVTNRHRVWLDVWVRAGASATQITLHNGYQHGVKEHVFDTKECTIFGATFNWHLMCDGREYYRQ